MTISQLIEQLQKLPQDTIVLMKDYEYDKLSPLNFNQHLELTNNVGYDGESDTYFEPYFSGTIPYQYKLSQELQLDIPALIVTVI